MSASQTQAMARPQVETAGVRLALETSKDGAAVLALVDRAFGPGRYAKVSERVREGNRLRRDLSFCAFEGERLIGSVRQWPVLVGLWSGAFLGPIAVDPVWRKKGVAGLLIEEGRDAARLAGEAFILLVGDLSLFGPHGFEPVPPGRIALPGPVDPTRVLACPLQPGVIETLEGQVHSPRLAT